MTNAGRFPRAAALALALAAVLAALALVGCGGSEGRAAGRPGRGRARGPGRPGEERPAVPVAVEPAISGTASSYYTTTAALEPQNHAEVRARATGFVRQILREEGDPVEVGQVLLLLEDDEARVRVRQAEANLRNARAEYERGISMRKAELLSAEEFEKIENELHLKEADLELAKLEFSYTRVSSPLAGRVVRRLVDLGANVSPGTPLFEVMDVEPLLARVHIPAKRMGFVRVGQEMEIRLESGEAALQGVVSLVSPIVDPTTGTVKVTAEIHEYPLGTRPGDFARVRIVTDRHAGATLVPSRAIFEERGENVLYVVEDAKAARRIVRPGYVDGERTEILEGVSPGELVVVKGQRQLREGAPVEVLEGPPEVLTPPGAAAADET